MIGHLGFQALFKSHFLSLWADVDVGAGKKDSIAARIEGMTIEGDVDSTDIDGTQAGLLPFLELGDVDSPKRTEKHHSKVSRKSQN